MPPRSADPGGMAHVAMTIVRALAGLVLGMIVFAGLLYYLLVVNFSQRLEDPEVYNVAISDTDAYNRIYDEVLVDDALEEPVGDLLGGVEVGDEVRDDAVEVLRDVMPPAYLREQTEANIQRFTSFLVYDLEGLEFYVELQEPLDRIEPAVLDWVYRIIDELEITDPASSECSEGRVRRLAAETAVPWGRMSDGELPEAAPSLNLLTRDCRQRGYDEWFDRTLDDPSMNSEAARILEEERENLRPYFVAGDTREFLKHAATQLFTPLIDDAVRDIRRDLQRGDRLDLLEKLAENSDDLTRADIDRQADDLRNTVQQANGPGRVVALAMVIVGILLMAAVHFPKPAEMLRWPGITLLMGGGVCLAVGFVVHSAIPGEIKDAIVYSTTYSPEVPTAAINLGGDLLESFARQSTAGFVPAAVAVMVIGGVLLAGSFVANILWGAVRRVIPGTLGGNDRR